MDFKTPKKFQNLGVTQRIASLSGGQISQTVCLDRLPDRRERGLGVGRYRQEPSVEIFPFRSFCQQEKGLVSKN